MNTDRLLDSAIDFGLDFGVAYGVARLLRGHRAGVRCRRYGGNALGDRELGLWGRYEETSYTGRSRE